MALISIRSFLGEIPKLAPSLLPENAAQQSSYVDHSRGYLTPLKSGLVLKTFGAGGWTAGGAAINSMYSRDGVGWYTTSVSGVKYFRSPVIDESFNRIYYTTSGVMQVSQWDINQTGGGPPASAVNVGVPAPTTAPALALIDLTTLPDYPSATFVFTIWYDSSGLRYQQQVVTPTTITALKQFRFTAPNMDFDPDTDNATTLKTPTDATLVCQVEMYDGTKLLFRTATSFGSATAARTQALPGGIEVSLSKVVGLQFDVLLSWGVVETRAYIYTMINAFNEESAPSPATLISPTYIQNVQITTVRPSFTGYKAYQDTNIYRTYGGTPAYLKIDKSGSNDVWVDASHKASSVGYALPSAGWITPPATMSGLQLMANGWFAAFNNNTLYMSEPYRPHTWPYNISFPTGIRGICPTAQGLCVTTFDETYMVTGSHPASVMPLRIPIPVGGVSSLGMTNVEGMVAFISHDGIVLVQGSQASLDFSEKMFTRTDWRNRYGTILTGMTLSYHDGFLIGSSPTADSNSGEFGFIVRIDEAQGQYTRFNKPINCTQRLPILDTLYFSTTDDAVGAKNVYSFNEGPAITYTWWSKDFVFPGFTSFGGFYIRTSGPVRVTIFQDGVQLYQVTCSSTGYYRVPSSGGLRFSVKLDNTTADIFEFVMGQTLGELQGG